MKGEMLSTSYMTRKDTSDAFSCGNTIVYILYYSHAQVTYPHYMLVKLRMMLYWKLLQEEHTNKQHCAAHAYYRSNA